MTRPAETWTYLSIPGRTRDCDEGSRSILRGSTVSWVEHERKRADQPLIAVRVARLRMKIDVSDNEISTNDANLPKESAS